MFESAKLKHHVDKAVYRREAPKLRQALLKAQYDLKQNGGFPVLIIIAGVEGAGKSETVNLLNEWMDPRHIVTTAFADRSDEERERPSQWRFWRALPPRRFPNYHAGTYGPAEADALLERDGRAWRDVRR